MNRIYILVLRTILSLACAIILTRLFHPEKGIFFIAGLAVILVSLAYFLTYLRVRGQKEKGR
ncbi:MAG: hypothetical protein KKD44_18580 [Proteobacteria bacterium]|nr:hypothetical protein [Pseudomonadota bacterium]